jgi:hypothetical protein
MSQIWSAVLQISNGFQNSPAAASIYFLNELVNGLFRL